MPSFAAAALMSVASKTYFAVWNLVWSEGEQVDHQVLLLVGQRTLEWFDHLDDTMLIFGHSISLFVVGHGFVSSTTCRHTGRPVGS